jgi:hypothetical protein
MIGRAVDVELARQQWNDGRRRIERLRSEDESAFRHANAQVELVADELRGRIGQTFTLAALADAYEDAVEWARDTLDDARPEGAPAPDTATVVDAAFHLYARGASDYRP